MAVKLLSDKTALHLFLPWLYNQRLHASSVFLSASWLTSCCSRKLQAWTLLLLCRHSCLVLPKRQRHLEMDDTMLSLCDETLTASFCMKRCRVLVDRSYQWHGDQTHHGNLQNHQRYSFTVALHVHIQALETLWNQQTNCKVTFTNTDRWADVSLYSPVNSSPGGWGEKKQQGANTAHW